MKKILKKTLSISSIILAIALITLGILFISAYSKRGAFSQINLFTGNEQIVEAQSKDSDDDGLTDWQENLFKTDISNPDTDGDSYLDGEEVNSGHNPLVRAPGDEQVFYPLPLGEKYNLTQKIITDENIDSLFVSYLTQKKEYTDASAALDSQEAFEELTNISVVEEMWEEALGETFSGLTEQAAEEILEMPDIFNIEINDSDIKISEDNSKEYISSYLDKVSLFLNADTFFLQQEVTDAVQLATEEGNFSKLDSLIQENDARIEEMKIIAAPSTWKELHKQGVELTLLTRNIFVSFRDIIDDPLKAYIALDKLESVFNSWNKLFEDSLILAENQEIKIPLQK